MEIELKYNENLVLLGAGASVDFGLPTWKQLEQLLKIEIGKDQFSNKIMAGSRKLLNSIGTEAEHQTLDQALSTQPGTTEDNSIEKYIFEKIGKIFDENYKTNNESWLWQFFLKKLKYNKEKGENFLEKNFNPIRDITFINFNYDNILVCQIIKLFEKILQDKLATIQKPQDFGRDKMIRQAFQRQEKQPSAEDIFFNDTLQTLRDYVGKACFYPHGYYTKFFEQSEIFGLSTGILPNSKTFKGRIFYKRERNNNHTENLVSCYDAPEDNGTYSEFRLRHKLFNTNYNLYVLGISPTSLEINGRKIRCFQDIQPNVIYFTCKNEDETKYRKYFNEDAFMNSRVKTNYEIKKCRNVSDFVNNFEFKEKKYTISYSE